MGTEKVRMDKWLWSVRVFKTRNQATEACKKGRVFVNNQIVKPSKEVHPGEIILVRKLPVIYTFKVLGIPANRVSAKIVNDYVEDLTSIEELEKLKINESLFIKRDRGTGRPTKKERRVLDNLINKFED